MYNTSIILVEEDKTVNEYGDLVTTTTEHEVFCDIRSIGLTEFYQAQAVGLKPEIKFILPDYMEYHGEKKLKYAPFGGEEASYAVIRTYRQNNQLEIVCKRGIDE